MLETSKNFLCSVAIAISSLLLGTWLQCPALAGLDFRAPWPDAGSTPLVYEEPETLSTPELSLGQDVCAAEVLFKVRPGLNQRVAAHKLSAQYGLTMIKRIPRIDVWVAASYGTNIVTVLHDLKHDQDVLWTELNGCVYASGITPDDDFYEAQQWNLRLIGLPEAWTFTTGNADPVAVIDTGISLDHPDLAAKIWTNVDEIADNGIDDDGNGYIDDVHGWNFVTGSTLIIGELHGTHVAGIAGAHTDNGIGVAGVSWRSSIMPLQALRGDSGTYADVAEAIVYATDNGAHILNLSLGGEEVSDTLDLAIAYARDHGCLIVAAAGNNKDQPASVLFPAASQGVLAVAATMNGDTPWSYSNRGPEVDVAAPGVDIFSTSHHGYGVMSGTSMAAPHVSGLAALVWSMEPDLTSDQVTYVITSTARDVYISGWDQRTGWGRIDAHAAIAFLKPYRNYLPAVTRQSPRGPQ